MLGRRFTRWRSAALLLLTVAASAQAEGLPPLEAYGRLPAMELARLSPSGQRFAFAANTEDRRRLLVASIDDKKLLAMPAIGEVKLRDILWGGEQFVIAATSNTVNLGLYYYGSKFELDYYQSINLEDGQIKSLLKGNAEFNAAFGYYGTSARDGAQFAYFGAYRNGNDPSLVQVDLKTNRVRQLSQGCDDCVAWLLGADGQIIAHSRYDERSRAWQLHAGGVRGRKLIELHDPHADNILLGEGRTPGTVLYARTDENGASRIMELALDRSRAPEELLGEHAVDDLIFDPRTRLLAGYVLQGDEREIVLLDEHRAARLRGTRKAFPGLSVRFDSWSDDFNRLIVFTQGAGANGDARGDAGTYWLVDITSGKADILGEAYPRIRPQQVGPWRMVDYRAADGLALHGVLTLPPQGAAKNLPLVVLPHGGPESRDHPGFNWWAQAFASRGYAVWQPNFRGSSGYGVELRNAGYGEWGAKMQTDISDGVAELARQGLVDPQRACIVGASYGGYAALAGVTLQQGLYRCAVSVAGVTDLKAMMLWDKNRKGEEVLRYTLRFLGASSIFDARVAQRSPAEHAAQADAPILLIHGKDDTVVPYAQSVLMRRSLQKAAKPVELLTLDREDHWLSREATRTQMLKAAVAFVQRHNPAVIAQASSVKAPD